MTDRIYETYSINRLRHRSLIYVVGICRRILLGKLQHAFSSLFEFCPDDVFEVTFGLKYILMMHFGIYQDIVYLTKNGNFVYYIRVNVS